MIRTYGEGKGSAISNQNYRINDRIRVREVRLIDENNQNQGIMAIKDARDYALSKNLDLVEVAPEARPPVCRVMDYGKFMYEQDKKARTARKSQKEIEIKGLRIRPDTDEYHIGFKVRQARGFLQKGNKVRITCQFRGRERSHPEIARRTMTEIAEQLADIAVVEQQANFEGRNMTMVLAPNSTVTAEKPKPAQPKPAASAPPQEQRPTPAPSPTPSEGQPTQE